MSPDLEAQLFAEFPRIFRPYGQPRMRLDGYGLRVGDGWYDLLHELCDRIQQHAAEHRLNPVALQVKEKFGVLQFYMRGADDFIVEAIETAERMSRTMCEVCGEPGTLRTKGWRRTMCDHHDAEYFKDEAR